MDYQKVAQAWKKRGFSCDLWTDPAGQRWEGYVHETDELLMLVEGGLELDIAGKSFKPKIGEEVFIPKNAVHSVRTSGASGSKWLYGYKRN